MNAAGMRPTGPLRWISGRTNRWHLWLLASLGHRAIDMAAAYGTGAASRCKSDEFDLGTYRRHIPAPVTAWNKYVATTNLPPPHYRDLLQRPQRVVQEQALPAEVMGAGELTGWLKEFVGMHVLKPDRHVRLFEDPDRLVRTGYWLARIAGRRRSPDSPEFAAALCMVGLGAICFFHEDRCELCFRIAIPGLLRCGEHSQSKLNLVDTFRDRAARSQASRRARRTLTSIANQQDFLGRTYTSEAIEGVVAGILWPIPRARVLGWRADVARALQDAPLVRSILPNDFFEACARSQLAMLKAAIDPCEWSVNRWPGKIGVAQRWLEGSGRANPGRPVGLRARSRRLAAEANELLAQGLRPSEVAVRLNITRSHLSHLRRRSRG